MADLQFTGLGVHLKVKDIKVSREFYESLGFKPVFGYGDEAFRATLRHLETRHLTAAEISEPPGIIVCAWTCK